MIENFLWTFNNLSHLKDNELSSFTISSETIPTLRVILLNFRTISDVIMPMPMHVLIKLFSFFLSLPLIWFTLTQFRWHVCEFGYSHNFALHRSTWGVQFSTHIQSLELWTLRFNAFIAEKKMKKKNKWVTCVEYSFDWTIFNVMQTIWVLFGYCGFVSKYIRTWTKQQRKMCTYSSIQIGMLPNKQQKQHQQK